MDYLSFDFLSQKRRLGQTMTPVAAVEAMPGVAPLPGPAVQADQPQKPAVTAH
jgi:hypothetical protein